MRQTADHARAASTIIHPSACRPGHNRLDNDSPSAHVTIGD
jgi:hypothetical protein